MTYPCTGFTRKAIGATFEGQTKEEDGTVFADVEVEGLGHNIVVDERKDGDETFGHCGLAVPEVHPGSHRDLLNDQRLQLPQKHKR